MSVTFNLPQADELPIASANSRLDDDNATTDTIEYIRKKDL